MYLLLITIVVPYGRAKYGNDLNAIHYGVIGSMQQVARILFSIYIGKTLQKVGKKNYILIGFGLMVLASAGFAISDVISSTVPYLFFFTCLFFNFIMGAGATCL
jgi:MFS family permease